MRKMISVTLATLMTAVVLIGTAGPAQARSWGWNYSTYYSCLAGSWTKWATYVDQGYTVTRTQWCERTSFGRYVTTIKYTR